MHQADAGTGQADSFAIPEGKKSAREIRIVEDGVEAVGGSVAWIFIAGGIKSGDAVTDPILVDRQFGGRHLRVDVGALAGDGI